MANENLTREQVIEELRASRRSTPMRDAYDTFIGTGRALGEGILFNWATELEAYTKAQLQNRPYEEVSAEVEREFARFQAEHPNLSLSLEMIGSIAPTIVAMRVSPRLAATTTLGQVATGAIGGGVTGAGATPENRPLGAAVTAAAGAGIPLAFRGLGIAGVTALNLFNKTKDILGERVFKASQDEIRNLVNRTDRTQEQVIQDLLSGRLLTENQSLNASINALRQFQGVREVIDPVAQRRQRELGVKARESLLSGITDLNTSNIKLAYNTTEDAYNQLERQIYPEIFNSEVLADPQSIDIFERVIRQSSEARNTLKNLYDEAQDIYNPLFEIVDGNPRLLRSPDLQDMEIVRRQLRDLANDVGGQRGANLRRLGQELKESLDRQSPELAAIRQQAFITRSSREAFQDGLKIGAKPDDVEIFLVNTRSRTDIPDEAKENIINAFRSGYAQRLSERLGQTQRTSTLQKILNEDSDLGRSYRMLFPRTSEGERITLESIANNVEMAVDSSILYQSLGRGARGRSTTSDITSEFQRMSQGETDQMLQDLTSGNIGSFKDRITRRIMQSASRIGGGLTNEEAVQVAQILTDQNPARLISIIQDPRRWETALNQGVNLLRSRLTQRPATVYAAEKLPQALFPSATGEQ